MAEELVELGYRPDPFTAPEQQGAADGVRFEYRIEDGSRTGDTVTLAVAVHENEGKWPEVVPHWLYISPPDTVLAEQVRGPSRREPSRPTNSRMVMNGWRSALRRATSGIGSTHRTERT